MEDSSILDFKYKLDKIERYFCLALIVMFFATNNSGFGVFIFTFVIVFVLVYYFKIYKSKPSYVLFNGDDITFSQGIAFKLKVFKTYEIATVTEANSKIEVVLKNGEKVSIIKILLSQNDYNKIFEELLQHLKGNA